MLKYTMSPGSGAQPMTGYIAGMGVLCQEGVRHQPRPALRTRDELQRRFACDRVDENPHARIITAGNVVVRRAVNAIRGLCDRRDRCTLNPPKSGWKGHSHLVVIVRKLRRGGGWGKPVRASVHRPVYQSNGRKKIRRRVGSDTNWNNDTPAGLADTSRSIAV